jgi:hypothetical protein
MSATGSCLSATRKTFDALPFVNMILPFQCPELRKHPGVGLNDLTANVALFRRMLDSSRRAYSVQPSLLDAGSVL